jgi:hypothetical protein
MNMYATLTFTSVVAWAALVFITVVFLVLIVDALKPRSRLEVDIRKLEAARTGYSTRIAWPRVGVMFVIWFVSGWYLFG